jgi:hypothetical protein
MLAEWRLQSLDFRANRFRQLRVRSNVDNALPPVSSAESEFVRDVSRGQTFLADKAAFREQCLLLGR